MGEFEISGSEALKFIQKMTVNDASKLTDGKIQYSCMCYDNGGIVDDLLVYRLQDRFMMVVNASNIQKDFDWLRSHQNGKVELSDISDQTGLLAIQGPRAQNVVSKMADFDFDSLPYYNFAVVNIAGHDILLSRTGYTGEDGFELYIPHQFADDIWNRAVEAGKEFGMKLIGLAARDSLRLEMKLALYGNDIDQTTNPIEAGLSWIVNFEKGDFIARDILEKTKKEKPKRRLSCLEFNDRVFPRHGYEVVSDGEVVGKITSGTFSPSLGKPIAMAYLPLPLTRIGNIVQVKIREKPFNAEVVKPPFYKKGTHR